MERFDTGSARLWRRLHRYDEPIRHGICSLDLDPPSAPAPDPAIGQAAAANAEVAKEALDFGREQWAWNKAKAEEIWPQAKQIIQQQVDIANKNKERSDSEWDAYQRLYRPAEEAYVQKTLNWDTPERRTQREQEAVADVNRGYNQARGTMERGLQRVGVRPGGAGYTQGMADLSRAQAADTAGAMNSARRQVESEGMAGLERLTNIGRGRPSTSFAGDQMALTAGNSAQANQNQTIATTNAGMNSAQGWFNTGLQGYGNQGSILNNQYGNQLRGWQAEQQAGAASMGGLGTLAGQAFLGSKSPWIFSGFKDGGLVRKGKSNCYADGGLVRRAERKVAKFAAGGLIAPMLGMQPRMAGGGLVRGPGTETSDSVPAVIDGQQPAALSTGEAVLNAEAVDMVGEDFVERINQAGLQRRAQRSGETIEGESRRVA